MPPTPEDFYAWHEYAIEWVDHVTGDLSWTDFGTDGAAAENLLRCYGWTRFGDRGRVVRRLMTQDEWEEVTF